MNITERISYLLDKYETPKRRFTKNDDYLIAFT